MDPIFQSVLNEVVAPTVITLLTAAGGWLVTKLPGPLRDFLQTATHARDMALVSAALARRALVSSGTAVPPDPVVRSTEIASYAYTAMPKLISKLDIPPAVFQTMVQAAIKTADAVLVPGSLVPAIAAAAVSAAAAVAATDPLLAALSGGSYTQTAAPAAPCPDPFTLQPDPAVPSPVVIVSRPLA